MTWRAPCALALICGLALPAVASASSSKRVRPAETGARPVAAGARSDIAASTLSVAPALERFAPNLTWSSGEVFHSVGAIRGADAPDYHGTAFWYNGHLGVVFAKGMFEGGISMFDVSDPRNPKRVGKGDHALQREGHSTGFIETAQGVLAVTNASNGFNLWDLNDPTQPRMVKNVSLQGIKPSDYDFGSWWIAVQAPYVYMSGSYNGLYIVDLSDISRPRLVDRILMDGGFRCGALYVAGNLLYQSSSEGLLTRVYDISDPESPQLLKEVEQTFSAYATFFNGGRLYEALESGGLEIMDLEDPADPVTLSVTRASGGGAYVMIQDSFAHLGNSGAYYKIDFSDPLAPFIVGQASIDSDLPEVDNDFVSPIGNLAVVSDDHNLTQVNAGSRLIPHQAAPDTLPPRVNFVSPAGDAEGVLTTSRIGLTFTDQVLVSSVTAQSLILREVASGTQVPGVFSVQQTTVNFSPSETLRPETLYEVVVPAGGIRDLAGNPTSSLFLSSFVTGPEYVNPPNANAGADKVGYAGEPVLLDATRTTGGQGALEYSWDPGDGSPQTAWSSSPILSYTYGTPAHRTAILKVRDSAGQVTTDSARITAVERPLPVPPTWSATLALDEDAGHLWVVNPDADTVTVIDTLQLTVQRELPAGRHPASVALTGLGDAWAANRDSSEITVFDADGLTVRGRIALPAGSRPFGVARDPLSDTMFVTLEGTGQLLALDAVDGSPVWTADVGPTPRGIAVVEESIYVSRFISPATHGEVVEVDRASGQVLQTWTLAEDPGPDSENNGRGIPNYLTQVVPSPDGGRLFVPSIKQNTNRGTLRSGEPLTFESTNRAILSVLDLSRGEEALTARFDFDNRDHASALALSEHGDYGFVALQGSQGVIIVDLLSGQEVGAIAHVGHAPQGLVVSDGLLFVQNFMGRDVTVYDIATFDDVESVVRTASIRTVANETLSNEVLVGKRIFYNASDTRMSRDSYISCAGCHLDGGSDRRVWDFTDRGEGLRRTTTLRGRGGMLHGPVHWSANFDEIQDFENDIRGPFAGTGYMSDSDFNSGTRSSTLGDKKAGISGELDAMAAYVSSLAEADASPYRNADGSLTDAAKRGRDLFRSATVGCGTCHTGPHFTDSTLSSSQFILHDVGTITAASGKRMGQTLTGIDTPTLKGVWNNAPYLHDGSAATLRDVLVTRNTADKHGKTSTLTPAQLSDLEAYVRAIDARSGGPVVVSMSPSAGQKLRAPKQIAVSFSSWLDGSSVTASSIQVTRDGNPVSGTLAVVRDRVTFTPATALAAGKYTVLATTAIRSVDGDAGVAWSGTFEVADVALVSNLKVYTSHASSYALQTNLKAGVKIFGDDDERILKLPAKYGGLDWLRTANDDRNETRPVVTAFDLSAPAKVYVAFSRRMTQLPGWAAEFKPTGDSILTTDKSSPMPVYVATFPAGRVLLGGSRTDGGDGNAVNHFVFFGP